MENDAREHRKTPKCPESSKKARFYRRNVEFYRKTSKFIGKRRILLKNAEFHQKMVELRNKKANFTGISSFLGSFDLLGP